MKLILSISFSKRMERTRGERSGYGQGTGPAPLSILGKFLLNYCKSVPVKTTISLFFDVVGLYVTSLEQN